MKRAITHFEALGLGVPFLCGVREKDLSEFFILDRSSPDYRKVCRILRRSGVTIARRRAVQEKLDAEFLVALSSRAAIWTHWRNE